VKNQFSLFGAVLLAAAGVASALGVSTAVETERMSSGVCPLTKRPCHGGSRAYRTGEDTPDTMKHACVRVFNFRS
jgi:hypothetical protein